MTAGTRTTITRTVRTPVARALLVGLVLTTVAACASPVQGGGDADGAATDVAWCEQFDVAVQAHRR